MKLENVIHIHATPQVVWEVTADVERWPEWAPTVKSVQRVDQGPFGIDSVALIKQPGLPEARWSVSEFRPGECFTWETRIRGIQMRATHELSATETGTKSLLRVELSGLVARLLWPFMRASIRRSLKQENRGLKRRCETS